MERRVDANLPQSADFEIKRIGSVDGLRLRGRVHDGGRGASKGHSGHSREKGNEKLEIHDEDLVEAGICSLDLSAAAMGCGLPKVMMTEESSL